MKDGPQIASRPFAAHPVNRGKLCPKGLSEHYTLESENRAQYPLLRQNGKLLRVELGRSAVRDGRSFPGHPEASTGRKH